MTPGVYFVQRQIKHQEAIMHQHSMQAFAKFNESHAGALHSLTREVSITPGKSLDNKGPTYTQDMDLPALVSVCEELCKNLEKTVKTDVLSASATTATASPGMDHPKSTVI
jgi:hypothetical protein